MLRITGLSTVAVVSVVALGAVGFAMPARGTASAASETLYYGKTSKGLTVSIPVTGTQIPRDLRAYLLYRIGRSSTIEFHPGWVASMSFHGGRLSYHHLAKSGNGSSAEVWFQAALAQGGKLMTGTYREHDFAYGRPADTGTIRFTATAWAGRQGVEWAGKTADGRPLDMSVNYRLVPTGTITVGNKTSRSYGPAFAFAVPATARPLACQDADGTTSRVVASLPALSGTLKGSDDLANAFSPGGGLRTPEGQPARGTATGTGGASIQAELAVKWLRWQGGGLAATGTLSYQGTLTTETGVATCARTTSTFTLRPR